MVKPTNGSFGLVGENAISSRLSTLLREAGYSDAEFERIFNTLKGTRKPDVSFTNKKGLCIISAKLGSQNEVEAISTAQEYQQDFSNEINLAETFAVTYPDKVNGIFHLRVLANKHHGSIPWSLTTLVAVSEKIKEVCENEWDKAKVGMELETTASIRVLRSGVIHLTSSIMHISSESFEDLFGGKDFFESVTGYTKTNEKTKKILRSAAAYLFINQILFYEILSSELTTQYDRIKDVDLDKPESLMPNYFQKVLHKDYRPIFNFDVAGKFDTKEAKVAAKRVILAIRALFPGKIEHDLIGKVFHNIIPLDIRKTVGAYYTNSAAGDLLARIVVKSSDDLVMDLACGSGTLLVSAYKRKAELLGSKVTKDVHKRFVERELTGIDIMPFSAHLAAVNLALRQPLFDTDNVNVAIEDSTLHKPGDVIPAVRETLKDAFKVKRLIDFNGPTSPEKVKRGVISLANEPKEITLKKVDVVIMNPPFTSCDNLPSDYKVELKSRFQSLHAYEECLTGKLSFQAYFLLLADKFLKEGGRVASVLPLTTFSGKAFAKLDEFIINNYSIEYIVVGLGRTAFSDNTALTEILLVARKDKPKPGHKFVLIGTKKSPTAWATKDIELIVNQAEKISESNESLDSDFCVIKTFSQESLRQSSDGLTNLILKLDSRFVKVSENMETIYKNSRFITELKQLEKSLGCDLFAYELRIKGGAFYGYSALSISESEQRMKKKRDKLVFQNQSPRSIFVRNRFTNDIFEIPNSAICQQLRRLTGISSIDISQLPEYVVSKPFGNIKNLLATIYDEKETSKFYHRINTDWESKIQHGRSYICIARRINLAAPGTKLLSAFSDKQFFIAANAWGIRSIDQGNAEILTLWFNSSLFLLEFIMKRATTEGTWGQIDERYLFESKIPDITLLSTEQKNELLSTFRSLKETKFLSLLEQLETGFEARQKIDKAFLNLLEVTDVKEQNKFLGELYKFLAGKIKEMRETMRFD